MLVCYIDYGGTDTVDVCDLKLLPEELQPVTVPPKAQKCSLRGVRCTENSWSEAAVLYFEEIISEKKLLAEARVSDFLSASCDAGLPVRLLDMGLSVGAKLIEAGHAVEEANERNASVNIAVVSEPIEQFKLSMDSSAEKSFLETQDGAGGGAGDAGPLVDIEADVFGNDVEPKEEKCENTREVSDGLVPAGLAEMRMDNESFVPSVVKANTDVAAPEVSEQQTQPVSDSVDIDNTPGPTVTDAEETLADKCDLTTHAICLATEETKGGLSTENLVASAESESHSFSTEQAFACDEEDPDDFDTPKAERSFEDPSLAKVGGTSVSLEAVLEALPKETAEETTHQETDCLDTRNEDVADGSVQEICGKAHADHVDADVSIKDDLSTECAPVPHESEERAEFETATAEGSSAEPTTIASCEEREASTSEVDMKMKMSDEPPQSKPPMDGEISPMVLPTGTLTPVFVSCCDSPNEFYIQLSDTFELDELTKDMQDVYNSDATSDERLTNPKPGMLCAAFSREDSSWYRARIVQVTEDNVLVHYVDFGGKETVTSDLRQLQKQFVEKPAQALKCELGKVNPLNTEKDWSNDCKQTFVAETGMQRQLLAELHPVNRSIPGPHGDTKGLAVNLYADGTSIADILVNAGVAAHSSSKYRQVSVVFLCASRRVKAKAEGKTCSCPVCRSPVGHAFFHLQDSQCAGR